MPSYFVYRIYSSFWIFILICCYIGISGDKITFLTVGGRTSAVVLRRQKKEAKSKKNGETETTFSKTKKAKIESTPLDKSIPHSEHIAADVTGNENNNQYPCPSFDVPKCTITTRSGKRKARADDHPLR